MSDCSFCGGSNLEPGKPCARCGNFRAPIAVKAAPVARRSSDDVKAAVDSLLAGVSTLERDAEDVIAKTAGAAKPTKTAEARAKLLGDSLETIRKAKAQLTAAFKE